jgi:hypothetical protein
MYTLRFRKDDYEWVVGAKEYGKDPRREFAFVIANGVEYQVGGICSPRKHKPYDVCFVTNSEGKTIDRIGPFEESSEVTV